MSNEIVWNYITQADAAPASLGAAVRAYEATAIRAGFDVARAQDETIVHIPAATDQRVIDAFLAETAVSLEQKSKLPGWMAALYGHAKPYSPEELNKDTSMKTEITKPERTFGFEMTGLVGDYKERDGYPTDECEARTKAMSRLIASHLYLRYPENFDPVCYYIDGHCMEFPSPVFSSFEKGLAFYRTVSAAFRKYRCTPQNPVTVCGGNHLHFGGLTPMQIRNVVRAASRMYCLPWVFTQPDDTDSCDNVISQSALHNFQLLLREDTYMMRRVLARDRDGEAGYRKEQRVAINKAGGSWADLSYFQFLALDKDDAREEDLECAFTKSVSVCPRRRYSKDSTTVEFRCVEAPRNESEFKDQFDFFSAFVDNYSQSEPGPVQFMDSHELNKIKPSGAVEQFTKLCDTIGVDYKRYVKYVRRNLYPRWKLGRKRC